MKRTPLIVSFAVLVVAAAAYGCLHFRGDTTSQVILPVSESPGKNGQQVGEFRDTGIGLDFMYRTSPDGYVVIEPDIKDDAPDAAVRVLTLFRTSDYAELLRDEGLPREGPESINIQVFNPGPNITPIEWATQHPAQSNYQADAKVTWSTIDGNAAARYSWDGLFQGQTVIIARKGWVYMFTLLASDSGMLKDFNELLSTLKLQR